MIIYMDINMNKKNNTDIHFILLCKYIWERKNSLQGSESMFLSLFLVIMIYTFFSGL